MKRSHDKDKNGRKCFFHHVYECNTWKWLHGRKRNEDVLKQKVRHSVFLWVAKKGRFIHLTDQKLGFDSLTQLLQVHIHPILRHYSTKCGRFFLDTRKNYKLRFMICVVVREQMNKGLNQDVELWIRKKSEGWTLLIAEHGRNEISTIRSASRMMGMIWTDRMGSSWQCEKHGYNFSFLSPLFSLSSLSF